MKSYSRLALILFAVLAALATRSEGALYKLTTVVAFNGSNGSNPDGGLVADANGNLFGTTQTGGTRDMGTVFEINGTTGVLTTLVNFNGANGAHPSLTSLAFDSSGNLFGVTQDGGANSSGTVYRIAATTHVMTTLASFNGSNGANPEGHLVIGTGGLIYGTTLTGGANHVGTVFQLSGSTLSAIVSFNQANGSSPFSGVIADANGNLYGATDGGGGSGTVFEVNPMSHALTTLATFNGTNGANPDGRLLFDTNGNLFGTTSAGGSDGSGAVFEVVAGSHALITLASIPDTDGNGGGPVGGLIADASGNLFGTTFAGGTIGSGCVFGVTAGTHSLMPLASLDGINGAGPYCDLLAGPGGTFYGTAYFGGPAFNGGASGLGTVFKLSPVPEPSTIVLAGSALFALGILRSRRQARA
jgi:uncharacterized repeat protein (TIGR03803 family)